ncbi:MAG: PRC-barrel domain-containing protein [Candidatus Dormiibacterota bacterium]
MGEAVQYRIGAQAGCSDGSCGHVSRVVVDPVARAITHLVVEPGHRHGVARLVPIELVEASGQNVQLRCTIEAFEQLEPAEEAEFLPESNEYGTYDPEHVLTRPYYRLGAGGLGMSGLGMSNAGMGGTDLGATNVAKPALNDTVPPGGVSVRRGDQVYATDGPIGSVHGLVIDPRNQHVTHVMLEEGHLWGHKEVAIPISAVTAVDAGIQIALSKAEIRDLPPVDIDRT